MQNSIKGLKIYRHDTDLILEILFFDASQVEYLLYGSSCSETSLLFCNDIFRMWRGSAEDDFQHDFAWMADKADDR